MTTPTIEAMPVLRDVIRRAARYDLLVEALAGLVQEHDDRYDDDLKLPDTPPMRLARAALDAEEATR